MAALTAARAAERMAEMTPLRPALMPAVRPRMALSPAGRSRLAGMAADTALLSRPASEEGFAGEAVFAHARADACRHVAAGRLHARGGRLDAQRAVERSFEVGGDGFGVRGPARLGHALRHALLDVRADAGQVSRPLSMSEMACRLVKVLLADLPALLDGGDQFAHVGGQLRDALRVKVELQYAFYLGQGRSSRRRTPAQNLSQPP